MITIYHVTGWIHSLYWGAMWLLLAMVWFLIVMLVPSGGWKRLVALVLATIAIPGMFYAAPRLSIWMQQNTPEAREARTRYETAKAIFDERCKQAGEKIYRTASGVEGITLLSVYPRASTTPSYNSYRDPMWPDAALPEQWRGKGYISSFLDARSRLLVKVEDDSEFIGFQYVDVLEPEHQYQRYQWNIPEKADDPDEYLLVTPLTEPTSRYAVHYEALVDPADRQYWVAGAKVTVIDQQNNEVMATKTWYALEPGQGATGNFRWPWRFVVTCPQDGGNREAISHFVRRVIQPKP